MQTLQFVLLQMDEAARHARDGRLPQLRIALLLLDNAVEVLLHRWAEGELIHDAMTRRLHENAKRWMAPDSFLEAFDISGLLPPNDEHKVLRFFDRLLSYAVRKKVIEPEIADALSHLHRYRNEAYHRAKVRDATIRTSVTLLFDIAARLVLADIINMCIYSSGEDYTWLSQRFAMSPRELFPTDQVRRTAVSELRAGLPEDAMNIPEAMAIHLDSRIEQLFDALDFISESARPPITRAEALSHACGFIVSKQSDAELRDRTPRGFTGDISLRTTDRVREAANLIRVQTDMIAAFRGFAAAEAQLEHLEFAAFAFAAAVESMIQQEIDILRGK